MHVRQLLHCARHYVLGDQEYASAVAQEAAAAVGSDVVLILYEDTLADARLLQVGAGGGGGGALRRGG